MSGGNPKIQFDGDVLHDTTGKFPTFVPGQTVSGKVIYSVVSQSTIDEVVLIFKGKCFTWIKKQTSNGSTTYKEKIELFRFHQSLFRGPYTMQTSKFEWPFSFVLPETTSYVRERGSDNALYNNDSQPLPPSMDAQEDRARSRRKAIISYELKIKVNPNRLLHSEKVTQPIMVVPYSSSPLPQPMPTSAAFPHQSWTSKELRPEQHSFRQKMSHVFGNDPSLKTPAICFGATVHIPRAASIWQLMPIALSIQHRRMGPTDPENPVLELDSIHLQIKAYTNLRVKALFGNHDAIAKAHLGSRTIRGQQMILPLDNQPIQVTDTFRLVDLCQDWRLPPSFNTYTINHSYGIKLTASIRHPGTHHIFQFETKIPFEVFPTENPNQKTQAPMLQNLETNDMSAPAYDLAANSSPPQYSGPSGHAPLHGDSSSQEPPYTASHS